jgi:hypothetical protein
MALGVCCSAAVGHERGADSTKVLSFARRASLLGRHEGSLLRFHQPLGHPS